jgi:hypothetical protein
MTKYAMGVLKSSVHSCFFCYELRRASLEEEITFFERRLGANRTLIQRWLCVASIGLRSHSSSAASQLWCGSTCGHPSTTGFREKPTAADCPDSLSLVTATVVEAGEAFRLDGRQSSHRSRLNARYRWLDTDGIGGLRQRFSAPVELQP